jgi:hypothetical protein
MTVSAAHFRLFQEAAAMRGGRPRNSPGWGMLVAVKSGAFVSSSDASEHATIEAGKTRVSPDYWLARERPELFNLGDRRDTRTYNTHRRNLENARAELERGRPTSTRRGAVRSTALTLPGQPFKLPRSDRPFKLPRRKAGRVLP